MSRQSTTQRPRQPPTGEPCTDIVLVSFVMLTNIGSFVKCSPESRILCRSTIDGLVKIVRNEGVRVLYRGMDLNLLVGVPMVRHSALEEGSTESRSSSPLLLSCHFTYNLRRLLIRGQFATYL